MIIIMTVIIIGSSLAAPLDSLVYHQNVTSLFYRYSGNNLESSGSVRKNKKGAL